MAVCRNLDEVLAAADADAEKRPLMSQAAAQLVAAILAARRCPSTMRPSEQAPSDPRRV
jgi:hypothetical protein